MTERTLILIKPDGVKNGHVGEIISRIERKGLKLAELDLRVADRETAEKHYAEHKDKPFFGELVDFITSAPLVAGIVEGEQYKISTVSVSGDTVLPKEEIEQRVGFFVKPGDVFSRARLELATESITGALANIGYAFAQVQPAPDVDREGRTVGIVANQPNQMAGTLNIDASEFESLCAFLYARGWRGVI